MTSGNGGNLSSFVVSAKHFKKTSVANYTCRSRKVSDLSEHDAGEEESSARSPPTSMAYGIGDFLTTRRKLDLDKHEALNGDLDNHPLHRSTIRSSFLTHNDVSHL